MPSSAGHLGRPDRFSLHERAGVTFGHWPELASILGADITVTTAYGGVSRGPYGSLNLALHVGDDPAAVRENRRRAAAAFGCQIGDLVFAEQVHGTTVAQVHRADDGRGVDGLEDALAGVDALVTSDPSIVLVTMVADCVPVAMVDPAARLLATVHAGWRGALGGIAEAALDALVGAGAERERVVAVFGPSVAANRYQVGPDVADAARRRLGIEAERFLQPDGDRHWRFDLAGSLRALLVGVGVTEDRIVTAPAVTGAGSPFYSDRAVRPCGRFALMARLRPYDEGAPRAI